VKNKKEIKNRSFFFLISFLFLTSLLSIKTLKKVDTQDIRISGSELFSQNYVIKNSSLNFPIRLIFVETNLLEKELKQNLSLKNVSVNRELFPFGLKVHINSRTPIAYGERILNDEKILGFIDKDGFFINKQNVDEKNLNKLKIQVFGWKEKFKKILSEKYEILYAGVLSGGFAFVLQIYAQKNINPAPAAIIYSLEGVFAAIAAWLILSQVLNINNILGCVFILIGVLLSQLLPEIKKASYK